MKEKKLFKIANDEHEKKKDFKSVRTEKQQITIDKNFKNKENNHKISTIARRHHIRKVAFRSLGDTRVMTIFAVLGKVHGGNETLRTLTALVPRLEHVDLGLGVSVEVRLSHPLVVAQVAHVLADPFEFQIQRSGFSILLLLRFINKWKFV